MILWAGDFAGDFAGDSAGDSACDSAGDRPGSGSGAGPRSRVIVLVLEPAARTVRGLDRSSGCWKLKDYRVLLDFFLDRNRIRAKVVGMEIKIYLFQCKGAYIDSLPF